MKPLLFEYLEELGSGEEISRQLDKVIYSPNHNLHIDRETLVPVFDGITSVDHENKFYCHEILDNNLASVLITETSTFTEIEEADTDEDKNRLPSFNSQLITDTGSKAEQESESDPDDRFTASLRSLTTNTDTRRQEEEADMDVGAKHSHTMVAMLVTITESKDTQETPDDDKG